MPATVTCCSAIASSSADCVFGVARLISSASSDVREDRAGHEDELAPAARRVSLTMRVPVMSAGIRSTVNWMRLKRSASASASERTISVLPVPGHALDQHVAAGEEAR